MNDLVSIRKRLQKKIRLHDAQFLIASRSHCFNVSSHRLPHKKKVAL